MNKYKSVLLCVLLIISCCLPAKSYADGMDIINEILNRPQNVNGMNIINDVLNREQNVSNGMDLINKALNGNNYQEIKLINSKQEITQEIEKSKNNPLEEVKHITGDDNSYILGVDISKWDGDIDWEALKKANIQFVIIRAGYSTNYVDPYFKSNIENAIKHNMLIGIYWFSYAHSYQGAELEALKFYKTIKPYKDKITLPVFFDFEYDSVNTANRKGHSINKKLASGMADTFCTTIKSKGLQAGIYTNMDYVNNYFSRDVLNKYHTWIAQWTKTCTYKGQYIIWQCADNFNVNGEKFDLNRLYYNRYQRLISNTTNEYKKMTVIATAYSGDSKTSILTRPHWGVIAVDPSIIPYGSIVYIKEFDKYFVAQDCGGGIKGYRIDIFMNSEKDCREWGRRKITIKILQ